MRLIVFVLMLICGGSVQAASNLEGSWMTQNGQKMVDLVEFNGFLTMNTRSFYSNGAPSDYFFEFTVPTNREVMPGETIQGRVRSVDGYYGCVFDEQAQAQLTPEGFLKVNYPLLTFHRETRSVRDGSGGYHYRRNVDWTRWGWVETVYSFPIERWRTISSECVIDQRNWITSVLVQQRSPRPK